MITRWLMTVLIQLDELANAILGGYAHETISMRMAFGARRGEAIGCLFCRVIQIILPRHCDTKASMTWPLLRPKK